jgi:chromosome segregation ATPase
MADKRVEDLEEMIHKVREEKEAVEKGKHESDLEVKRMKEELSLEIAKFNFTKMGHDSRVLVLEDKLRMSEDDVTMLRKRVEDANGIRETMERNSRELKDQLSNLSIELAASKVRETDYKTEKELLQSRIVELEKLSEDHKAENMKLSKQLQELHDAKSNAVEGLTKLDHERKKDGEEMIRLSKQLEDAKSALTTEEQRKNDVMVQLKTANEEITMLTRKSNDAKAAGEELVLQLENKIKTLTDALASKDHDLSNTSMSKDNADKVGYIVFLSLPSTCVKCRPS